MRIGRLLGICLVAASIISCDRGDEEAGASSAVDLSDAALGTGAPDDRGAPQQQPVFPSGHAEDSAPFSDGESSQERGAGSLTPAQVRNRQQMLRVVERNAGAVEEAAELALRALDGGSAELQPELFNRARDAAFSVKWNLEVMMPRTREELGGKGESVDDVYDIGMPAVTIDGFLPGAMEHIRRAQAIADQVDLPPEFMSLDGQKATDSD